MAAYGYIRVSTGKQANQGHSLDAQQERIRAYCATKGLQLVRIYTDPGQSARKPLERRTEGRLLVEGIDRGEVTEVVVYSLSRLFRSMPETLTKVLKWNAAGVGLHIIDLGGQTIDTGTTMGQMLITMMAGFAQIEREQIAERTSDGHQYLKGERKVYTRDVYGYDHRNGVLVPNPAEQHVLHIIKRGAAKKWSDRRIAALLNWLGHKGKRGGSWHGSTVKYIRTNELHEGGEANET